MRRTLAFLCVAALLAVCFLTSAQSQQTDSPQTGPTEVAAGARFLIRIQDRLSTKEDKAGRGFTARTLEALTTGDGTVLRAGSEVRGHIDKVVSAGKTGRARMWLTFDDIRTAAGWKPLVADLIDVPGVHSIHVAYDHEGEIEASSSKRDRELQAAAAGALVGAAPGITARDKREAALGAAVGAATAFMATSGLGQEITLEKDTKLELILSRALYLGGS
jgi:hypothetical protein